MTNADRIRNMSDEELAEFLCKVKSDYQWMEHEFPSEEEHGEWEDWLQSEAEQEVIMDGLIIKRNGQTLLLMVKRPLK